MPVQEGFEAAPSKGVKLLQNPKSIPFNFCHNWEQRVVAVVEGGNDPSYKGSIWALQL